MKKTKQNFFALLIASFSVFLVSFRSDTDSLHKRLFVLSITEIKNGVPAKKAFSDELSFKNGKLFSDFLFDKFQYKWIKYRINKDSVFTDFTDTEIRYLEVEASATDENNQTIYLNFTTSEWDIDGTIKITKNDKLKKAYDFVGREKGGKPKKEKKKTEPENTSRI